MRHLCRLAAGTDDTAPKIRETTVLGLALAGST